MNKAIENDLQHYQKLLKKTNYTQMSIPKEASDLKLYLDGIKRLQKRLGLKDSIDNSEDETTSRREASETPYSNMKDLGNTQIDSSFTPLKNEKSKSYRNIVLKKMIQHSNYRQSVMNQISPSVNLTNTNLDLSETGHAENQTNGLGWNSRKNESMGTNGEAIQQPTFAFSSDGR